MKLLEYKNISGSFEFDSRDNVFIGEILNVDGYFPFFGDTEDEAVQDFKEVVEFYLENCEQEKNNVLSE